MARGPAAASLGPRLLRLLPLLLLLRGAGCSRGGPSGSLPPAARGGPRGDKDAQQPPEDAAAALGPGAQDVVTAHMLRLYEKYRRQGTPPGGGNTVRSFRARLGVVDQKAVYVFNLSSMQDSEAILAATFHFYAEPAPRWARAPCDPRAKNAPCRPPSPVPAPRSHWLFRSLAQNAAAPGPLRGALALVAPPRGLWQARDVSAIVRAARRDGEPLLAARLDPGGTHPLVPAARAPYVLVRADDLAISEPNSVAATLQRYDPSPAGDAQPRAARNGSADPRVRRAAGPLQNNELPGLDERPTRGAHLPGQQLWPGPYRAAPRPRARAGRRRKGPGEPEAAAQVLDFDEQTLRTARRRQGLGPRACARRYLKVDFADIGWSEWVLLPKSFDAYFCAGACEFPMPKIVRPSNHATIQSIVRAVGIIPGIPEPCCVPDKMNSLGVLFLDEDRNVVLKVYPNMSVETCACR
ncbi:growth/differentiation factor 10 [Ctenodactylus gundi]